MRLNFDAPVCLCVLTITLMCLSIEESSVLAFTPKVSTNHNSNWRTFGGPKHILSSSSPSDGEIVPEKKLKTVVIGGGWAGFSAADALSTDPSTQVILLDASPRGSGGLAGGWRTKELGLPVEAGIHGFWREYTNTIAAIENIEGINVDDVLTPYTPSILVSQSGRQALAPVLGARENEQDMDTFSSLKDLDYVDLMKDPSQITKTLADLLPPPLDVALLSEFEPGSPLTNLDRISGVGLLGAWADFEQESAESWARYDKVSAENLFRSAAGITPTLYKELVSPLLHVLPMTPGYDCSAAAALSCFHVFALQSRGAFDVRWCRGAISEKIFNPWAEQMQSSGVEIRGSSKVTALSNIKDSEKFKLTINENETIEDVDAVVFAVGATSMKKLVKDCPPVEEVSEPTDFARARGVTCVAVRLFLRPHETVTKNLLGGMHSESQLPPDVANAMKDSPVIVCGPNVGSIEQLAETGFCIYDLQRMHDEFAVSTEKTETNVPCAVLEVDFFRADLIANLNSDQEVAELALRAVAAALDVEPIDSDQILDVAVVRARDAVSHFSVGSSFLCPSVKLAKGIYMSGDWVDRAGHASWSTEKAVVTGRQAAEALSKDFGLKCETTIIPAAPDTEQLSTLRKVAKLFRDILPTMPGSNIPPAPWVLLNQITSSFRR